MKYAIAALLGLASAGNFQIPQFDVNQAKVEAAVNDVKTSGMRMRAAEEADKQQSLNDLVHAYATFETSEYINLGKSFKSWVEFDVMFYDAITVDATCNQEKATLCLNTWILQGADMRNTNARDTCSKAAGCSFGWEHYTPAQKQAAEAKYNAGIQDITNSYKEIWGFTEVELQKAKASHEVRKEAIKKDFIDSTKRVASELGCNT